MLGLINSHVHLEFSSNSTTLKYGNFYVVAKFSNQKIEMN